LLFVFLAAALGAQGWLRQQTLRLRAEAIVAKRAQVAAIVHARAPPDQRWAPGAAERLGAMGGGRVTLFDGYLPPPPEDPALLYFDHPLVDSPLAPVTARFVFPASPISRLLATYQRVTVGLLFFGFALLAVGVAFAALTWRSPGSGPAEPALPGAARADIGSLTRLAETSLAQTAALTRERDVRRLAEEDAQLQQALLHQSLEGKVRLGHDLHDGIIQSLYASGLTIESARALVRADPAEADRSSCGGRASPRPSPPSSRSSGPAATSSSTSRSTRPPPRRSPRRRAPRPCRSSARRSATASAMAARPASPCACTRASRRSASSCRTTAAALRPPGPTAPAAGSPTCRRAPAAAAAPCGSKAPPAAAPA
ncbi:MAG: histidine kinase, partial [Opitutales bacterium]|nr:histidine kinase [Opitutales bacterium]